MISQIAGECLVFVELQPVNRYLRLDRFQFDITGHYSRAGSFRQSDAESVGVRDGISGFNVGRGKHEGKVCRHDAQRKLIDDSGCALGLLESMFALCYIEAFAIIDQRKQHKNRFLRALRRTCRTCSAAGSPSR